MAFMSGKGFGLRSMLAAAVVGGLLGCEAGGVGDPCIPDPEEYVATFPSFSVGEVNITSRSYECESRVCLVNNFQGRVSCPYGTNGPNPDPASRVVNHDEQCQLPGGLGQVQVAVRAQRLERRPEDAVYCSCRCAGPDPNARYCECPAGFECRELVRSGQAQGLAGSYCIRSGTFVDDALDISPLECDFNAQNCGPADGS